MRILFTLFTEHNCLSAGYCKQSGKIQITGPGSLLLCCFGTQAMNPSPQLSLGIWRDECRWAGRASESWRRQQSATDGSGRPATGTDTDQTLPMCQSRQLSVWRRRRWLIIDRLRLCCFPHTFSAFRFPLPPRLDRGCDMKSRRPVFGNVTSLFFFFFFILQPPHLTTTSPPIQPPSQQTTQPAASVAMAPAGSPSRRPLVYLNSSCPLNLQCPIHSAAASLSEEGMSETPRCLTLHKLTEVQLRSLCPQSPRLLYPPSPVSSGPRKHPFTAQLWRRDFGTVMER